MSQPLILKNPQIFIGYSHLGSCREFVWEAGYEAEAAFQPSRFLIRGLKCVRDLDGLMLRDDMFLHTPENGEYLLGNFNIVDITNIEEIRGMAASCRLIMEKFPETKNSSIGETVVISKATHLQAFRAVSALIGNAHSKYVIDARAANEVINELAKEIIRAPNAVLNLISIKSFDDYTFSHNINVATISLVIGHALGLSTNDLQDLGTGALMHDLGKIKISQEILNKEGRLSDSEFVEITKHPLLGMELTKNSKEISPKAQEVISQHHEKFQGRGYPFGKSGDKIPLLARICAIADAFDAMTTARPFRAALTPYQAIRNLISLVETHFDPEILSVFLKKVSLYPPGSIVELSNGLKAVVLRINPDSMMRPVVKVLSSRQETTLIIDLSANSSLFIKGPEVPPLPKGIKKKVR